MFRDATVKDAAFIIGLRTDTQKSQHLSYTSPSLVKQYAWLDDYLSSTSQAYFIIEGQNGDLLGTVRLYDPQNYSFCWGSWILKTGSPAHAAIESALMVYAYAIDHLGFKQAHFDVRKGNKHVWSFHERFGAVRTSESEENYFYRIDTAAIAASRMCYKKYLPHQLIIEV